MHAFVRLFSRVCHITVPSVYVEGWISEIVRDRGGVGVSLVVGEDGGLVPVFASASDALKCLEHDDGVPADDLVWC